MFLAAGLHCMVHTTQSDIIAVHTHFTTNVSQMHYDRVYNC